ncbi:helix-turn-helix domain-containing protein [Streptomyces hygroscopicus subsp. hygroscopicus]|uniref:IclR family transcriptional regulator domain-containing protein n=1 Tax=Streptomyces hygroscopicus TaxID=1912 RepID=UPI001C655560|nr:IclR family transcriptional regulator C-terminal domain-containing protein [Streptomyces hygroscopicus]MBW8090567.1 helix-turn-helix domain-containing protein [Streptomyces hygroscopicus subsp. hygroscopicus]
MVLRPEPTAPFHSVQHALRILEVVAKHASGVSDTTIARETRLPAHQLTDLLRMLRREGYVEQITDGAYVGGSSLSLLGSAGPGRGHAVRAKLQQSLFALRDSVGAAVYLSRYTDGEVRITQYADGPRTPRVHEWVDFRSAAHAMALGKCLLTQLDHDSRRDHLSRHKTVRLTSRTTTSEKALFHKLDSQPATVPVLDLQEYAVGTVCAAVPISAGRSVGCLALSLPLAQAHRLRQAADALNREAAPMLLSLSL